MTRTDSDSETTSNKELFDRRMKGLNELRSPQSRCDATNEELDTHTEGEGQKN